VDEKKVYRQTIMFSATMPLKVELLAKKYLRHPIFIAIGDRKGKASGNVTQRVEMTTEARKRDRLLSVLREDQPPFIVFCNSKKSCDSLQRVIGKLITKSSVSSHPPYHTIRSIIVTQFMFVFMFVSITE
jgi:ATP-dependent RNA helicase DDX23/PRP28